MAHMVLDKELAKKVLAHNLEKALKERGLTKNKFAEKIGMVPQQLTFYFKAKREAGPENLDRMAKGLGLPNGWELLRMPDGFAGKHLQEAWNALIDLQLLSADDVVKARDYIQLLIETRKTPKSPTEFPEKK